MEVKRLIPLTAAAAFIIIVYYLMPLVFDHGEPRPQVIQLNSKLRLDLEGRWKPVIFLNIGVNEVKAFQRVFYREHLRCLLPEEPDTIYCGGGRLAVGFADNMSVLANDTIRLRRTYNITWVHPEYISGGRYSFWFDGLNGGVWFETNREVFSHSIPEWRGRIMEGDGE